MFVHAQRAWQAEIRVDLDAQRHMARSSSALPEWHGWVVDVPLVVAAGDRKAGVEQQGGMVGDVSFRDFGTAAHRGETQFSTDDAYLLDWWLEANAYRGRLGELVPAEWPQSGVSWQGARLIERGAIRLSPKRARD
jgi:hypothetical protein